MLGGTFGRKGKTRQQFVTSQHSGMKWRGMGNSAGRPRTKGCRMIGLLRLSCPPPTDSGEKMPQRGPLPFNASHPDRRTDQRMVALKQDLDISQSLSVESSTTISRTGRRCPSIRVFGRPFLSLQATRHARSCLELILAIDIHDSSLVLHRRSGRAGSCR